MIDQPYLNPDVGDVYNEFGSKFSVDKCKKKQCNARKGNSCPAWMFYRRFRDQLDSTEGEK